LIGVLVAADKVTLLTELVAALAGAALAPVTVAPTATPAPVTAATAIAA